MAFCAVLAGCGNHSNHEGHDHGHGVEAHEGHAHDHDHDHDEDADWGDDFGDAGIMDDDGMTGAYLGFN